MDKGDTEKQAVLRDAMIKKSKQERSIYIEKISSALKDGMNLLDIGCGTAHIISQLASRNQGVIFFGLDLSSAMLKIALENNSHKIIFIQADGMELPCRDSVFDIVINRLADYSISEVYRILKKDGCFFEYGLGPHADEEIKEFFPDRIDRESFCIPEDIKNWKEEVSQPLIDAGLIIEDIQEYYAREYFRKEEEIMDLIEMVPLVKDFDREKDRKIIIELAKKYRSGNQITTTWHYYVIKARK